MFILKKARANRKLCFIISAPRSGSTWLQTSLNSHPGVFSTEHRFFGNFFEIWPDNDGTSSPRITLDKYVSLLGSYYRWETFGVTRDQFEFELTRELVSSFHNLAEQLSGKNVIADKITPYLGTSSAVAESIIRFFPKAKIIFLIRDGRDVLTSGVFDWMKRADKGKCRFARYVEGDDRISLSRFFESDDIKTWCGYWTEAIKTIEHFQDSAYVLKYEAMKLDQTKELSLLLEFLEVDNRAKVIDGCINNSTFVKMSKGRPPGKMDPTAKVRKGVSGDWKNYFTRGDAELFLHYAGKELIAWGYEPDELWAQGLPTRLDSPNASSPVNGC